MDSDFTVLIVALVFFFVVGMALFAVWKLFEPIGEGETRSLRDFIVKPAGAMAIGVACLGIYIVFPQALLWTVGAVVILGIVVFVRMPPSQRAAIGRAISEPDDASRWPGARLILATILVFAAIAGLLAIFIP